MPFLFLDDKIAPPVGHTRINCHITFDVKMDLTRKARFSEISFLLAALNDCEILTGDIGNVYLNAFTTEKIYYRAGLEWGETMK